MKFSKIDWNSAFEFAWRVLVFVVAIGIILVVSRNWTRWEGGSGWQRTNDAYLKADITPIAAKVVWRRCSPRAPRQACSKCCQRLLHGSSRDSSEFAIKAARTSSISLC